MENKLFLWLNQRINITVQTITLKSGQMSTGTFREHKLTGEEPWKLAAGRNMHVVSWTTRG